jgi:hypothetical protein
LPGPLPLLLGAENAQRFHAPSYMQHAAATDIFTYDAGGESKTFPAPVNNLQ